MKEHLATWWRQASAGTYYWRCKVPAAALPGRVNWLEYGDLVARKKVKVSGHLTLMGDPDFPRQEGVAIWQFAGNATRATLMGGMQEMGIRVLMELDDNYLIPAPIMRGWQEEFDRSSEDAHSLAAHREIAKWVDGIIVSTPRLAEAYADLNENVYVCPNSLAAGDWNHPAERDDGILRIGWAASKSHIIDAHIPRRAMEWASRQDGVEVYMVGLQPDWRGKFKKVGWTEDLHDYRKQLTGLGLDVGICPLQPSDWANCKSDVKCLEYAIGGAVPVVSRTEPYRPWWDSDAPCLSCATEKDWEQTLRWIVKHRDEVRDLGRQAFEYVLAERTIEKSIGSWHEAIEGGRHGEVEVEARAGG